MQLKGPVGCNGTLEKQVKKEKSKASLQSKMVETNLDINENEMFLGE